jgi:hypothetical protein
MEPTSKSARKTDRKSPSAKSSDEYLANQISDARLALESTLDDLTLDLAHAADLRRWVRRYPWAALGTALAAGFTLAYVATKPKRQDHEVSDAGDDAADNEVIEAAAIRPTKKSRSAKEPATGWRTMLLTALFDILRLAVTQIISASVRQAAAHAPPPRTATNDCQPEDPNQPTTPED